MNKCRECGSSNILFGGEGFSKVICSFKMSDNGSLIIDSMKVDKDYEPKEVTIQTFICRDCLECGEIEPINVIGDLIE